MGLLKLKNDTQMKPSPRFDEKSNGERKLKIVEEFSFYAHPLNSSTGQ